MDNNTFWLLFWGIVGSTMVLSKLIDVWKDK